jgi:hypothetical protein
MSSFLINPDQFKERIQVHHSSNEKVDKTQAITGGTGENSQPPSNLGGFGSAEMNRQIDLLFSVNAEF